MALLASGLPLLPDWEFDTRNVLQQVPPMLQRWQDGAPPKGLELLAADVQRRLAAN
jgi:hypothetical protein